ncbi:hypothetical protein KCM76_08555 [Zooshikella marina]|uniref:hypothetical protein n=1 Tax=Zooshikella ganghwensis TaxID=202772 RepID=UPI001BB0071D|nr:hypothetical protein [Zooshikella ganghwensis]MBU2706032.1 hypothetical protein [Zooshikella ganghwensis]
MKCHGVYVCRGVRNSIQYLFEGGQEIIDYFSNISAFKSKFEDDIAQFDNQYIRIDSP